MKTNKEILENLKHRKSSLEKNIIFLGIAFSFGLILVALYGYFIGTYPNMEVEITTQTTASFLLGKKIGHKYYSVKRWLLGE